jgi:hypothetical protein
MMPMGPIEFTPAEVAMIMAALVVFGVCAALPAGLALAAVGHRRAAYHPGWNALWYWSWGTALTMVVMGALYNSDLGWFLVPVSWIPALLLALTPRQGER